MVFSQTSHKTQSILKVVDIDRLKPEKSQQVNGSTGVVTDGYTHIEATPASPVATTSFSEGYLKLEPLNDVKMFHDSDSEFFQDLVHWCSTPAKDEQVQTIDSKKTEERTHTIDTPHTPISPQGWDAFDTNSPCAQAGFYNTSPLDPLSPNVEAFTQFDSNYLGLTDLEQEKSNFQEQFLDISSLPVVIGDLVPEKVSDAHPWPQTAQPGWASIYDTNHTKSYTNEHNKMPFIDQEDSLDFKYVSVIPREVENNNIVLSEYVVKDDVNNKGVLEESEPPRRNGGLSIDVAPRASNWSNETVSTPEILTYVEQLEKEKSTHLMKTKQLWPLQEVQEVFKTEESCKIDVPSPVEYEPITPKSESHLESDQEDHKSHAGKRRRHNSDDSDETYTPYSEHTPRKYKRRKPNIPIKDMIIALEGSHQLTKARRGRPPKRRQSTVSSVCSIDENSSCASTTEMKYRELRDKNNEASKRSRMNRKLKELQMEQLAEELVEKNKKLKVKADILEDMTKRLKDALMTAILQK